MASKSYRSLPVMSRVRTRRLCFLNVVKLPCRTKRRSIRSRFTSGAAARRQLLLPLLVGGNGHDPLPALLPGTGLRLFHQRPGLARDPFLVILVQDIP